MGEQSAKSLRGEKMEDVIFSGSDGRKPTAAAEVRLRFSGFLKTVSGPAFPPEHGQRATSTRGTATAMASNGHGGNAGNGNGHRGITPALGPAPLPGDGHRRHHPVGRAGSRSHPPAVSLGRERDT